MTFTFFAVIISIVCFFLVVIIMVQNPKGGGLSSMFGGNQQMIGSVRKTNEFLDRATWSLAGAVVVLAILSSLTIHTDSATQYDALDMAEPAVQMMPETPAPAAEAPAALPAAEEAQN